MVVEGIPPIRAVAGGSSRLGPAIVTTINHVNSDPNRRAANSVDAIGRVRKIGEIVPKTKKAVAPVRTTIRDDVSDVVDTKERVANKARPFKDTPNRIGIGADSPVEKANTEAENMEAARMSLVTDGVVKITATVQRTMKVQKAVIKGMNLASTLPAAAARAGEAPRALVDIAGPAGKAGHKCRLARVVRRDHSGRCRGDRLVEAALDSSARSVGKSLDAGPQSRSQSITVTAGYSGSHAGIW